MMNSHHSSRSNTMQSFMERHQDKIKGVLSGLDRIRFRGTLRSIAHPWGLKHYLLAAGIYLKDFKEYVLGLSRKVIQATTRLADEAHRPLQYLPQSTTSKEDRARAIAQRDGITQGLIAIFSTIELCWSFEVILNPSSRFLEIRSSKRKCLHYYHYYLDPDFGLLHARVQTWLPFTMHVCLNGRERLARQMDQAGLSYVQRDNCFTDVSNFTQAQALFDQQKRFAWSTWLDRLAARAQPAHQALFGGKPLSYYWSIDESEWATDVLFHTPADLARLYPRLVRHGIETLSSRDVLRYLGRKQPDHCPTAEVLSDFQVRPEGTRVKHRLNRNALKMYDKQQSVLRVETVINNPEDFKVYRTAEGREDSPKAWLKMRKGVADLPRRASVSQAANERYLEGLATVEEKTALGELAARVCRRAKWKGRPVRALNPFAEADARLLTAVSRGEFALNGFRNRDLRPLLFGDRPVEAAEAKRQAAAVTRHLRLLQAHHLIRKVAHTHRYLLSNLGQRTIAALLAARQADTATLLRAG
jgi:hypothetical protein